uniref:Alpha-macroglobulin receptor-binding domain-containing protein n=1 Tax=Zosterops lateralis melanops TaxID=1220523 RepID=A0A8D2P0W7_ZOSLA
VFNACELGPEVGAQLLLKLPFTIALHSEDASKVSWANTETAKVLKLGDISSNIQGSTVLLFHIFLPPSAQLLTSQSADEKSSSTIETVAYILLAHVSKPDLLPNEASVSKLVRWLSAQRNAFGGFASTQDTVVSLQALAQYAALIPQEIRDVKVAVKGMGASPLEFHVHKNNKLVLHQASLPADTGTYTVEATGSGCVYVQTTLYYNIPPPKTEVVFVLDVETVPKECDGVRKEFDIHVSVRYVGDRGTSNMALLEVEMLSGFIPVQNSVKEVRLFLQLSLRISKSNFPISLKLNISVEQDVEVQNLKAATVHVYDYYKPGEISLTLCKVTILPPTQT